MKESWGLRFEKWAPLLAALAAGLLWIIAKFKFPANPDALLGASAAVASIFASFLGVAQAIILGMKDGKLFKLLKELRYTDRLYNYISRGITGAVCFAVVSLLCFFVDVTNNETLGEIEVYYWQVMWVFAATYAVATYARVSRLLFKLLSQEDAPVS